MTALYDIVRRQDVEQDKEHSHFMAFWSGHKHNRFVQCRHCNMIVKHAVVGPHFFMEHLAGETFHADPDDLVEPEAHVGCPLLHDAVHSMFADKLRTAQAVHLRVGDQAGQYHACLQCVRTTGKGINGTNPVIIMVVMVIAWGFLMRQRCERGARTVFPSLTT